MSFFSNVTRRDREQSSAPGRPARAPSTKLVPRERPLDQELLYHDYHELISQRPALLDEKVKLHERIIDEFNLTTLEKLPREDLAREVRNYLGEYAKIERLSLNQRELLAHVRGRFHPMSHC
jgi:pilus assembly protein CpaF